MKIQQFVVALSMVSLVALNACKKNESALAPVSSKATVEANPRALPAPGRNKVAYYTFDAAPVNQGYKSLVNFTDRANIVIVFEGTLWELADTVNYNSGWMVNSIYNSKKQILDDIQTLRARGVKVLMNVDDAASWSTSTPFTTYNGTSYTYTQFASFINNCVNKVGLDGIALDVEHGAYDNSNYRNMIKELGRYFGPLSSASGSKIYTAAVYSGGEPGPSFRDPALANYMNFVMDMAYFSDNTSRFNYWAATLGNAKVMDGMVHDYNSQASAVSHAQWHPSPDKAGVMVYAANANKAYTDAILGAF
ncbi:MAG TPA: glycosyl hydrolase family 18 protein [Chitinophaga sp.]|uniref:EndoS/ChiA family endoglycosidase n=1 Tax=Chitinophaga sp. TaxID=1869181 RepID=UPI002C28E7B9|nr:glycosyl hydrolase family 18 protein [Chitinophaga sp.]HVI47802.1 glycosyl hydrolase family 18 protein [Chitinophaga sp.]